MKTCPFCGNPRADYGACPTCTQNEEWKRFRDKQEREEERIRDQCERRRERDEERRDGEMAKGAAEFEQKFPVIASTAYAVTFTFAIVGGLIGGFVCENGFFAGLIVYGFIWGIVGVVVGYILGIILHFMSK